MPSLGVHVRSEVKRTWEVWSYKFEVWFASQFSSNSLGQNALDWARLETSTITHGDVATT